MWPMHRKRPMVFTRNVMDECMYEGMYAWVDRQMTDPLWFEINISFFLKKANKYEMWKQV